MHKNLKGVQNIYSDSLPKKCKLDTGLDFWFLLLVKYFQGITETKNSCIVRGDDLTRAKKFGGYITRGWSRFPIEVYIRYPGYLKRYHIPQATSSKYCTSHKLLYSLQYHNIRIVLYLLSALSSISSFY